MLIPFYFLIGAWGGRNRVAATTKLVIYTLVGSLFMLVGAIAAGVLATHDGQSISFALSDLQARGLSKGSQEWIFLCFAAAFLVKMPAFPLHGWMPDATGRCRSRCWPSSRACSRRSPPTASCASSCRCSPTPRCTSRS